MNWELIHIGLAGILTVGAIIIGVHFSVIPAQALFGHPTFMILFVPPVYSVLFYWLLYPIFRPLKPPWASKSQVLARDDSGLSLALSIIGFFIPPLALAGIILAHHTRTRFKVIGISRGQLALSSLIVGYFSLGMYMALIIAVIWMHYQRSE